MSNENKLYADKGMLYTNGAETTGKEIRLAEGISKEEFYQISEEEYNAMFDETPENMATEEDYQNALRELRVEL